MSLLLCHGDARAQVTVQIQPITALKNNPHPIFSALYARLRSKTLDIVSYPESRAESTPENPAAAPIFPPNQIPPKEQPWPPKPKPQPTAATPNRPQDPAPKPANPVPRA